MTPMVSRFFLPSKALIMGANKNYSRGVNLELRLGTNGHEKGRKHSDGRLHSCLNFEGRRRAKFVAREVSGGERRRRGRDEENVCLREREIERAGIYCEAQCRLWKWKHVNRDKVMMPQTTR